MRFPINTVVEQPRPIEVEKVTPIDVEKPFKYIEKVNVPVDGKRSESTVNKKINPEPVDGLGDLSVGYKPSTKRNTA